MDRHKEQHIKRLVIIFTNLSELKEEILLFLLQFSRSVHTSSVVCTKFRSNKPKAPAPPVPIAHKPSWNHNNPANEAPVTSALPATNWHHNFFSEIADSVAAASVVEVSNATGEM